MKKFASVLIILAGAVWGTMGIFVNEMDKIGFSSLQTSSVRVTVAAVAMLVLLAVTDKSKLKIHIRDLYLFIILGVGCILGMSILYFYTIQHTSLSVAAILLYTSPIWVIIISAIFLHEKITWQKLLAVILAFLGCAMVSGLGGADAISPFFLLTGVGSGLAYGLYSIFGTVAMRKYHPYTVTAYSFVFAAIASWFIANAFKIIDVASACPNKGVMIFYMIATGIVTAFTPYMLYTCGLKHTTAGKAAVMACTEPLVATVLGFFIYGQSASLFGIILIILAILIVNNFGITKK